MPNYCYFRDRCDKRIKACDGEYPQEFYLNDTHMVSCYLYSQAKGGAKWLIQLKVKTTVEERNNNEKGNGYLLEVKNLKKYFPINKSVLLGAKGYVKAVDGVTLELREGPQWDLLANQAVVKPLLAKPS